MRTALLALVLLAAQAPADQWVEQLRSPDPAARRDALHQIDRAGTPEAAGAVAALVADPEDAVQLAALDTLLNLLLPERVSGRRRVAFIVEVRDSAGARGAFERGLVPARPVPPTAFGSLAAAMGDLNPVVRVNAAFAFGALAGSPHGLVPLADLETAGRALAQMLAAPERDLRLAASAVAARVFRAAPAGPPRPSAWPPALADALVDAMNRPDAREQGAAIEALGRAREARALDALTQRIAWHRDHGPRDLAVAAIEAVARIAHPSSADAVRALATDPWAGRDEDVRLAVLFARARLLGDGSADAIRQAAAGGALAARAQDYLADLDAP